MKRPAPGEKSVPLRQGRRQKEEGAPAAAEAPALGLFFEPLGRPRFFGAAAEAMRRILVDHARKHLSQKRGSGAQKVELDSALSSIVVKAREKSLLRFMKLSTSWRERIHRCRSS